MEEKQIGLFIRDRRLALGLTQQQLADKLGITDKAVSKWERGISYPDITLLRRLADALAVSVSELLGGEREAAAVVPAAVEDVVLDTVAYAETARRRNGGWRFWTFVAFTALCLIAVLVLFIIYLSTNRNTYMMLAIRCVAFGWAVCYPLLRWERYPVRGALLIATFAVFPFLMQFPRWIWQWAMWIALLGVIYLWAVYFIGCRLRKRIWLAAGWSFLLGTPLSFAISGILQSRGIEGNAVGVVSTALTAGACFLIDFALGRREGGPPDSSIDAVPAMCYSRHT